MVAAFVCAVVALVLAGAVTGVFFAFSVSVLPGLDAIPAAQAVPAMRSMNRKILVPPFLISFTGTPIAAGLAGILLLVAGALAPGVLFLAAAIIYAAGAVAPTATVNVPLNNSLDAAAPSGEDDAARVWAAFSPRWTRWNHLRTAASLIVVLLIGLGLYTWPA
ncbi:MAG: DUF1772 domain-containing protein [Streptosporangiales bacterium]|nr:DUF1772 domain-containing protein [Streptosporangiales bacterium]